MMKIDIRKLILVIFLIALLFNGFVAELIMWLCLVAMMMITRYDLKKQIGSKGYKIAIFFCVFYI